MQTLLFNTKEKTTRLFDGPGTRYNEVLDFKFDNISTVSIRDGYYEVMQKKNNNTVPVARLSIYNTNMLIEN